MATTLLPKYCRNEHFIKVKSQPRSSWIWKSMLIGRDTILKGIGVQVSSGSQTIISKEALEIKDQQAVSDSPNLCNLVCLRSHS